MTKNLETSNSKILIIDGDQTTIDLIANMFKPTTTLLTASNGKDGLAIARKEDPDLILLEIIIPDMDGYKVCSQLKATLETKTIPVIFLSTKNQTEDELTALGLGAIDFISKPIVPQILEARVKNQLSQKRARDMLELMSAVDALTSIPNRRRFDEYIDQEWRRATRNKYALSLLMIDIDQFKLYNDTYGHQKGDKCLRAVATEIQQHLRRPSDMVARYGGEEFSVILPDTPSDSAFSLAERIWSGIGDLRIEHAGLDNASNLTVSIGAATTIPNEKKSLFEFIEAADQKLYRSKRSGRNRITAGNG